MIGIDFAFKNTKDVHVEIPRQDCMESPSMVKTLGQLVNRRLDDEMTAFGKKFGFPVIYVFYRTNHEDSDGCVKRVCTTELFTRNQKHEAVQFARDHLGELGVFEPKGVTK